MLVINFLTKTENTYVSYILNLFNLLILVNSILQKIYMKLTSIALKSQKVDVASMHMIAIMGM